jgi:adenylosuccinate lyase
MNISPLDGRYAKNTMALQEYFSEYALMKYRTKVEIEWLRYLVKGNLVKDSNGQELNIASSDMGT